MGFLGDLYGVGVTTVGKTGEVFQGRAILGKNATPEEALAAINAGPQNYDIGQTGTKPPPKWSALLIVGVVVIAVILWQRK